jgi:hypothetical protein
LLGTRSAGSGRHESGPNGAVALAPRRASGIELDHTACYACTAWHTCLVFLTDAGVRLPLCESCLRQIVPLALERRP